MLCSQILLGHVLLMVIIAVLETTIAFNQNMYVMDMITVLMVLMKSTVVRTEYIHMYEYAC